MVRRNIAIPADLDQWLIEEAKEGDRGYSEQIQRIVRFARAAKQRKASSRETAEARR